MIHYRRLLDRVKESSKLQIEIYQKNVCLENVLVVLYGVTLNNWAVVRNSLLPLRRRQGNACRGTCASCVNGIAVYCTLTNQSQRLTYQGSVLLPTLQATARLLSTLSVPPGALITLATADHTYSTRDFMPHVLLSHLNISFYLYLLHIYINIKVSALDWQSLPERLCSRTPASTVLYRTGHSVMNNSFAVVLCVSESVKDIFRLHACLQDSSLFPHFLITTWPSTTADYGYPS
ncbi:hypothetical protein J6590_087181 [Homalodisca vitripennis]|nr:hypothetical protein J6590_087181 [Homalodisca vitripennis]